MDIVISCDLILPQGDNMNVRLRVSESKDHTQQFEDVDVIYNNGVKIGWLRFDLDQTTITTETPIEVEVEGKDLTISIGENT